MHKITIFNHKGGVGKTTLTVNIAAALVENGSRVLMIDSDPQCNLTSYLIADSKVNKLLDSSEGEDGKTIWSVVKPVYDGNGHWRKVKPTRTYIDNMYIVPGDIRLSTYENFLGDSWNDCFKRRPGAFTATTSMSQYAAWLAEKDHFDFVFYDTGPNIGPLNRTILLDSDFFIVPVACDLFSVRALSTLGQSLKSWILDWDTIRALSPDDAYLFTGAPKFLGYIPQRFKVYGQKMARAPSTYLRNINRRLHTDIVEVLREIDEDLAISGTSEAELGRVKDFGVLVQDAQKQGVAIADVVPSNSSQREIAWSSFEDISQKILARIDEYQKL